MAHGLSCPKTSGIFLPQGWKPHLLSWQVDSATAPPGKSEFLDTVTVHCISHVSQSRKTSKSYFQVKNQCVITLLMRKGLTSLGKKNKSFFPEENVGYGKLLLWEKFFLIDFFLLSFSFFPLLSLVRGRVLRNIAILPS